MLRYSEEKKGPFLLQIAGLWDVDWPSSSLPFIVVPPSFECGLVLLATLIRGGEGITGKMDRSFKPKYGTVSQVLLQLFVAFLSLISSFWLFSSQLQITLSSFLRAISLSDFSFRNFTTSDVDLFPFFAVRACSSCFSAFLFLVLPKRSTARLRCSSAAAFLAFLLSSCNWLFAFVAAFSMISSNALSS